MTGIESTMTASRGSDLFPSSAGVAKLRCSNVRDCMMSRYGHLWIGTRRGLAEGLRTLSLRDLHGYGIVQFIQQSSDNELLVEEGSLYPALQRLELNGWIDGVWGVTSNNRRAKIYKITAAGRKQLTLETRQYAKLTLAIARVMGAE